jgi:hypothetical protein
MPDITLEINEAVPVVLNFGYGAVIATAAQLEVLFDDFNEYDSDESAQAGGVSSGGWYITSDSHISAPGGILKKNKL